MAQTFIPYLTQLIQSIGWSLLHSLWQGALVWFVLAAILRAFPAMTTRLKHGCSLMALFLLACWVGNTAATQWQQLQYVSVRVTSGYTATTGSYTLEVSPPNPGFATLPESAWAHISSWMPWLMLAYGIGLLIMLARFGASLAQLHRLRRRDAVIPDEQMLQLLERLKLQMGIAQQVALRLSTRVMVPIVIGALRPLILLPASMLESLKAEELEAVLLHELAHISRSDFLINILQSCIETLLFFNPFVWWISACIRREREHCCDDLVVAYTCQPLTYARVLAGLAEQQSAPPFALAATGNRPLLFNRIKRIIEMKDHPLRYGHIVAACSVAALLLAISIVCLTPSFAQKSKNSGEEKAAPERSTGKSHTVERIIHIDSNGVRHEYSSDDDLPPQQRKEVNAALRDGSRAANSKHLKDLDVPLSQLSKMKLDSISTEAVRTAEIAINGVDWKTINRQVDSAMEQVATVDWPAIDREIVNGANIVSIKIDDPKVRLQIRQEMDKARREIALAKRTLNLHESQRTMEEARREMARAERRMEQARQEMTEARAELRRLRREYSGSSSMDLLIAHPSPPAPPSPNGIPAPPTTNPVTPSPAPPSMPTAPRDGSSPK